MLTFTIKKVGQPEGESARILKFNTNAPFRTEILPTLFKIQEFSCGSVVWIDSGIKCKRVTLAGQTRQLMSPIRICNAGFSENLSMNLEDLLSRMEVTFINANGERFTVKRSKETDSEATVTANDQKKKHEMEVEPPSGIKVTPVVMTSGATAEKDNLFAKVDGYVPRRVSSRL